MILTNNYLKKIFGHIFAALVDKLINTIGKEEKKKLLTIFKKIEMKKNNY